jgi:hypothetical protein
MLVYYISGTFKGFKCITAHTREGFITGFQALMSGLKAFVYMLLNRFKFFANIALWKMDGNKNAFEKETFPKALMKRMCYL